MDVNVTTRHEDEQLVEHVLTEVNRLREEYNIGSPLGELPKGKPGSVCRCPVARGLSQNLESGVCVDGRSAWFAAADENVDLSQGTQMFIERFDDGDFPAYEL